MDKWFLYNPEYQQCQKYFEEKKIKFDTDGYSYYFNYKGKGIHFCPQSKRIVGGISSEEFNIDKSFSLFDYGKQEEAFKEKNQYEKVFTVLKASSKNLNKA